MQKSLLAIGLLAGVAITWIDSRPAWDDTGVSAGLLAGACAVLAYLSGRHPWLWALAVGAWIPLWGLWHTHNPGAFLALPVALLGACAGWALRQGQSPARA